MEALIEKASQCKKEEIIDSLNPLVKEWFFGKFKDFSLTQLYGVKPIWDRKNILISAPTGGTKTLTAFLSILNYLINLAEKKEVEEKIYAVYVSPLKALSNDVSFNLIQPLEEINALAKSKGIELQEIRVGLRTGDTEAKDRAKMARKSPHILVTTPESLALIINSPKFSEKLNALEFVVVDEIHALTNKRGVHLSLSLERISSMSAFDPVRIGLSATISPLEEIAKFLVGANRECLIAEVPLVKGIDIDLIFPGKVVLEAESSESQEELYRLLDEMIEKHKTTLIFTNTRAATERIIHHLDRKFPGRYTGRIGAHHSSMSKEKRMEVEERLRKGELKVVVSSTSLELGIDIGSIDLVVLLRSPKSVSRALQRVGRAGHKLHSRPNGTFIVTDRDDLVECGILMKLMKEKVVDKTEIPKNCLDVLAQQIYGMAISRVWGEEEMLSLIRKSYCYSQLTRQDFLDVLSYLSGEYALEHRYVYAKIWYDAKTKEIGKRGVMARVIYLTNIGTIPSESHIDVVIQTPISKRGQSAGKIDEGFLERMKRGDVFALGGEKYQFLYTRGMKAYVKADVSKKVTIPSWFSEMLPLSYDAARSIGKFRGLVKEKLKDEDKCLKFIQEYIYCSKEVAQEVYDYFLEQEKFSMVPDEKTILVEQFKEEKEVFVFHTLFGRRVNDVLSRAYAYAAGRLRMRDIEVGISDNGFYLAGKEVDVNKIIKLVNEKTIVKIIDEAIERTDILRRRFRQCAARSLMILRMYKGREKSAGRQQVHSELLLSAIRKLTKDFPILREAKREVLEDFMDLPRAKEVLRKIENGELKVVVKRVPLASPFALSLVLQGRTDVLKMEDRVKFLKRMHELHLKVIEYGEKNAT